LSPWPHFADDEIAAVAAVLRSGKVNYWTGSCGHRFEEAFARICGTRHAVALANGTVALELALRVLGIGAGDEVIVPCRTFVATASAVVMCGATPVFADVDPDSQNLTVATVAPLVTSRTRAVIAVHLAGWPCDMDPLTELAHSRGLKLIEDCAQAHGAVYKGRPVGSLGDVAAFSFCQDKIMTTGGEGGMLVTNRDDLWKQAWEFKDHGKSHAAVYDNPPASGHAFRWLHESIGTNWRMTEMQAAIGLVQGEKLPEWSMLRRQYAARLNRTLEQCPSIRVTLPPPECEHASYKHYAFVRPERLAEGWSRDRILAAVNAEGIPCYSGSCSEIYLEKAFVDRGLSPPQPLPVARALGETSLMFLVHPTLQDEHVGATCSAIDKVMSRACGG
jgi:dTDP-4-amino-4,6-dideoxygalactose transaminase